MYKRKTLKAYYNGMLHKNNQNTRHVAKVIGLMTSSLPGANYGTAHYKYLEQDKTNGFKLSKGCFDAVMKFSPKSITDVQRQYNKLDFSKYNIMKGKPVTAISSDAISSDAACNNF